VCCRRDAEENRVASWQCCVIAAVTQEPTSPPALDFNPRVQEMLCAMEIVGHAVPSPTRTPKPPRDSMYVHIKKKFSLIHDYSSSVLHACHRGAMLTFVLYLPSSVFVQAALA
jgi:hypothetical protein